MYYKLIQRVAIHTHTHTQTKRMLSNYCMHVWSRGILLRELLGKRE